MKILVAVDSNPYSSYVAHEVGKMVTNTWADITLIGVQEATHAQPVNGANQLTAALLDYRENILSYYSKDECPYSLHPIEKLVEMQRGVYEAQPPGGMKNLKVVVRTGQTAKEILHQAAEDESDLIVIGCQKESNCTWNQDAVPIKVANEALCSVLVVKETKEPEQIVCCLDHDYITQNSLELINQLVTLYHAELKIVGITESDVLKQKVEKRMKQLLEYYSKLKISPWLEVVDSAILNPFIHQAAQKDLVALWMGPRSFLKKIFSSDRVSHFISQAPSSVLLLR